VVPDHAGLSRLPTQRVVCVFGVTAEQLAVVTDPLPDSGPLVLGYHLMAATCSSAKAVVADVLAGLDEVARELFPVWLPGAEHIDSRSGLDRRTVRRLAVRLGQRSDHFGPFLAELAEAALLGRPAAGEFSPETRARELGGVLRRSYGRETVALMVSAVEPIGVHDQRAFAAAAEWLANHAQMGVWIVGDLTGAVDRFPHLTVSVPDYVQELPAGTDPRRAPTLVFPALAGRPHPSSRTEQVLEAALARCEWAAGRTWNQNYQSHPLAPPIRIDLMWPDMGCVVEIDGPDHRGALKYSDDRRRDNELQVDGHRILRFTNEQVAGDLGWVLDTIERLLTTRRRDEGIRV
jgi:very-short-patch-repair endonuclease